MEKEISDETDKIAESLKQEIRVANIKILQENIGEFLLNGDHIYEFIKDLTNTVILPKSLREHLDIAIKHYDEIHENVVSSAAYDKIQNLTIDNAKQSAKIEEQNNEIQCLKSAMALLFKHQGLDYPSYTENAEIPLVGNDELFVDSDIIN